MPKLQPDQSLKKEYLACHRATVVSHKVHVDYLLPSHLNLTTNSRLDIKSLVVPSCRLSLLPCSSSTRSKVQLEIPQYITRVETSPFSPITTKRSQLRHNSPLVHNQIFTCHLIASLKRVRCLVQQMQLSTFAQIHQDHDRTPNIILKVLLQHQEEILQPQFRRAHESKCLYK